MAVSGTESTPPLLRAPAQAALRPSHEQRARFRSVFTARQIHGFPFLVVFIARAAGHWRRRTAESTTNKQRFETNSS